MKEKERESLIERAKVTLDAYNEMIKMLLDCGAKYKLDAKEVLIVMAKLSVLTINSVQHGRDEEGQKKVEEKFNYLLKDTLRRRKAEDQVIFFPDDNIN